MWWATLDSNQ